MTNSGKSGLIFFLPSLSRFSNVVQRLLARRAMSFNSGLSYPNSPQAPGTHTPPSLPPLKMPGAHSPSLQNNPAGGRGVMAFRAAARSVLSHPANRRQALLSCLRFMVTIETGGPNLH